MVEKTIRSAKVHFVSGKGGVGKTLVSQALARVFAESHKTLLVELSEEETNTSTPHLSPIKQISNNLFFIKIHPDQALYEYLTLKIPTKKIIDSFLSKSMIKALCSAMPGLSDLTRLGKIWFHADEKAQGQEIFEKIVVDMPSSGFVSRFLSIPSVVKQAVKIGPLAQEAERMREYFRDPHHARLHIVTLLEDLVVNETVEFYYHIKKSCDMAFGFLFINRIFSAIFNDIFYLDKKMNLLYPNLISLIDSLKERVKEESFERERFLKSGVMLPQITIRDRVYEKTEVLVDEIAKELLATRKLYEG